MIYKEDWTELLRSGKYNQNTHDWIDEGSDSVCALGALMAVGCQSLEELRFVVVSWSAHMTFKAMGGTSTMFSKIIEMNDECGKSFSQIADYIDTLPLRSRPVKNARLAEEAVLVNA